MKARVDDLFVGDEGVGQVTGRLSLRGELLTAEFEAASPRLSVSGSGRLALTDGWTPRCRCGSRTRRSIRTCASSSRGCRRSRPPSPAAPSASSASCPTSIACWSSTRVEQLDLKLFDYALPTTGRSSCRSNNHVLEIGRLRVAGDGTQLQMGGSVQLHDGTVAVEATGEANLGILQGFFRNLRSRGTAALLAQVKGPLANPQFSGSARIADGRIRHLSAPHGLEAINGIISFDGTGIRLEDVDRARGRRAGRVRRAHRPRGLRAAAAQSDRGRRTDAPALSRRAPARSSTPTSGCAATSPRRCSAGRSSSTTRVWTRRFEVDPNIFDLGRRRARPAVGPAGGVGPAAPLRHPGHREQHAAGPEQPRGYRRQRRPAGCRAPTIGRRIFGRAEVDRGSILFEGNRYVVTRGTIDFLTPPAGSIEPLFDIEAETRVAPRRRPIAQNVPRDARRDRNAAQLLAGARLRSAAARGGHHRAAVRRDRPTCPTPSCARSARAGAEAAEAGAAHAPPARGCSPARFRRRCAASSRRRCGSTPRRSRRRSAPTTIRCRTSARLILGKRLSPRAYLTFSRALGGATRDQIIVLEYDQTDRARLRADANRRPHVRGRFPRPPQLLMRVRLLLLVALVIAAAAPGRRRSGRRNRSPANRSPRCACSSKACRPPIPRSSIWSKRASGSRCRWRPCARPSLTSTASARFQDIQVEAVDAADGAVELRYNLVAVRAVDRMEFRGNLGLSEGRAARRPDRALRPHAAAGTRRGSGAGARTALPGQRLLPRLDPPRIRPSCTIRSEPS